MSHLQHEPSEKTRELVTALAVNGDQQSRIAAHIGNRAPSFAMPYTTIEYLSASFEDCWQHPGVAAHRYRP